MTQPNCPDDNAITDAIDRIASSGIRSSSEGDRQRENIPLTELIEADRYRRSACAAANANRGVYYTKLISPGTG